MSETKQVVKSIATGQRFEVLHTEDVSYGPIGTLYHLKPLEPIVDKSYADRYKFWGAICLTGTEIEKEETMLKERNMSEGKKLDQSLPK